MKKNLILNLCSLVLTAFLLVFLVFGWYVSNKEVSANGILGSTAGEEYDVRLMELNNQGEWVECNSISFTDIEPGNKFFFKLVLKSKTGNDLSLDLSFNELSSRVTENKIKLEGNSIINLKTKLPIYTVADNKVMINEIINDQVNPKTLYRVAGDGSISLADYKMYDAFKVYDLKEVEPNLSTVLSGEGINLAEGAGFKVTASNNERSFYFALEFNDELSLKNIDGFISSNVYLYQTIKIGRISLIK